MYNNHFKFTANIMSIKCMELIVRVYCIEYYWLICKRESPKWDEELRIYSVENRWKLKLIWSIIDQIKSHWNSDHIQLFDALDKCWLCSYSFINVQLVTKLVLLLRFYCHLSICCLLQHSSVGMECVPLIPVLWKTTYR